MEDTSDLITAFLSFQETEKSASPRTLRNYSQALNAFVDFSGNGFPGWKKCTSEHFRMWLFELMKQDIARSTIRLRFSALRSFYKFLVHRHGLAVSPLNDVQLPKLERKLPVVLTQAQCIELLELPLKLELAKQAPEWLPLRDSAILELFYSSGLRLSELSDLNVEDIEHSNGAIKVNGKGNKDRIVPIGSMALTAIQKYRHAAQLHEGPLFLSKAKKRATAMTASDPDGVHFLSALAIEVSIFLLPSSF